MKKGDVVWISRYAITTGIFCDQVVDTYTSGAIAVEGTMLDGVYRAGDWHPTLEAAQARAKEMAALEIEKLEKRLVTMRAIVENGAKVKT